MNLSVDQKLAINMKVARDMWQPIETLKCGGDAVLLFAEEWKDEDFNPSGVREGFRNEDDNGPIYSAKWNDFHECWDTVVNYEATHWMPRPGGPNMKAVIAASGVTM